ncbi:hypothetical protein D3C87_627150 [compost metagenome]
MRRSSRLIIPLVLLLAASPTHAHHIKGLPHFGYKDMGWYPQIPSKETVRRVKDHLIIATTIPGDPKAGKQVNIHLYVKQISSKIPLDVPIHYSITRKKLVFFTESIRPRTELKPVLELYQIATTFQKGGSYSLTLHLPDQTETRIPIEVSP